MTNEELENKISEKFVSIMRKIRNLAAGYLTQACSPYFKALIMACMEMMDKEKINFTMFYEEQQAINRMFRYFGVPDRIRITSNTSGGSPFQNTTIQLKDNKKLERLYNILNTIDSLLCVKDICDKLKTIEELTRQIEREYESKETENGR